MSIKHLIFGLFIISFCSEPRGLVAQNGSKIIEKSYAKCQSIKNGYYNMTLRLKFMTNRDTSILSFNCYFKKLKDDSIYSFAFHYTRTYDGDFIGDVLYTGDDFVITNAKDSTGSIRSTSKWGSQIKANKFNYLFYEPLTNKESFPFINASGNIEPNILVKLNGEESIGTSTCYHLTIKVPPDTIKNKSGFGFLEEEFEYWINKADMIPIQYSNTTKTIDNNDTLIQYQKFRLNSYGINCLQNDSIISLISIPSIYIIKTYEPVKSIPLLSKGSLAPKWNLMSMKSEKVSLNDFKGKVVILDFFYKSCYPCLLAIPKLINLYDKYKERGLIVIGIDPVDHKNNELETFFSKRGITYPVLLESKNMATEYNVSAYPTIYILDKTGMIIFNMEGYGIGSEKIIEDLILKAL